MLLPGSRLHSAGAEGVVPLASLHVTACLGVFSADLTRDLFDRMEVSPEVVAARTLAVVFPVLGQSLQSELGARRRDRGGGGGGGGAPLYSAAAWAVRGLQMAKGLAHLHAHRVVHRDVKPDNILTDGAAGGVGDDEDATLVVSDLGECLDMALHCEHGFETPAAHPRGGAAAYWSPEVAGAAVRTRGATIDYAKQVRVRACRCACVQSCLEPCRFARSRALPQDAWGLGYILWGMLSPDPAAAPYTRGGGYTEPPGTLGGRGVDGAAATALVRGLLRPAPGDRASLDDAVAALEAMLFVLPGIESARAGEEAVSRRCVLQPRDVAWGDESGRHVLRCALGVM